MTYAAYVITAALFGGSVLIQVGRLRDDMLRVAVMLNPPFLNLICHSMMWPTQ